jgi:hypothetical protein
MDDVRAVMDAAGCERAALFAFWEGGPLASVFAATHPERISALVLFGTFARRIRSQDYPWHVARDDLVAAVEHIVDVWGTDETTALESFSPGADASLRRWWTARDRAGASPGSIRNLIMSNIDIDVRPVLPAIQAPALVLQPEISADEGAYIAARIPGARLVATPGAQYLPWLVPEAIDQVEQFLTGVPPTPLADRVLATILFTDLVESTDRARELGDRAWGELLEQHHALVRHEPVRPDDRQPGVLLAGRLRKSAHQRIRLRLRIVHIGAAVAEDRHHDALRLLGACLGGGHVRQPHVQATLRAEEAGGHHEDDQQDQQHVSEGDEVDLRDHPTSTRMALS